MFEDDTLPPFCFHRGWFMVSLDLSKHYLHFRLTEASTHWMGFQLEGKPYMFLPDVWFWVFRLSFCHSLELMKLLCSPFPSLPPFSGSTTSQLLEIIFILSSTTRPFLSSSFSSSSSPFSTRQLTSLLSSTLSWSGFFSPKNMLRRSCLSWGWCFRVCWMTRVCLLACSLRSWVCSQLSPLLSLLPSFRIL